MKIFRRNLLWDRTVWLIAGVATYFVVDQWQSRGGQFRFYIAVAWLVAVALLFNWSELRIGRKQLRRGEDSMFLGLAAFVGEEHVLPDGKREEVWRGTAAGALAFEPQGIRWAPRDEEGDVKEIAIAWSDVYSWRFGGVIPFVGRAGYLMISLYGGRELVFGIHGMRSWRRAVREAAIVGPTLLAREEATAPPNVGAAAASAADALAPTPSDAVPGAIVSPEFPVPVEAPGVSYEAVIGLECHVELSTSSKMFCSCATTFGVDPNTQVCPVCTGQPGTLPVPNRRAIEYAMRIALALGSEIAPSSLFHRKNYFYPDMPKNYQISQYDIPLSSGGALEFESGERMKRVRIHRVHLEEDTGKTIHAGEGGRIGEGEHASIDYNRAGIPLVEIVSEADVESPEDARAYLAELRTLLLTLGVSDVRLEEGSLRCDANVSVRPKGTTEFGTKVEVKNMNSMRSVQRALEHEIERQIEAVMSGGTIVQETRHFDENTGRTIGGRSKEYSADYRYFPDPDLVPIVPSGALIEEVRSGLPELPSRRRQRFVADHGLTAVDARTLVSDPGLADAFEAAAKAYAGPSAAIARWYLGELAQIANERGIAPQDVGLVAEQLAELQGLVDDGRISISLAKGDVLRKVLSSGRSPSEVVEGEGLAQISDTSELGGIVDEVIEANPEIVDQIKGGKGGAANALVGQVMKRTKGQANAKVVQQLIAERLGS
ncbi:MAG: Asp-tRNA(Asn)/Glu-tRNA(Gln) amidotransferase subunit GatB [Actinomycetota bacterium]